VPALASLPVTGAWAGAKIKVFGLDHLANYRQSGYMEKIVLTRAGYEKIIRELEFLSRVERPRAIQEILETAEEGRVESNPDFQFVLNQRRQLDRRIKQLQQILANAEVLVGSNLSADKVRFNARVRVVNLNTGKEREFRMVGPLEADAAAGQLSMASPLGKALMDRTVGDRVLVQTPKGLRSYRILAISMAKI
jgi:transcription elongation factor GreA